MTPHRNVVHSEMARKNVPVLRTKAKFSSINDGREVLERHYDKVLLIRISDQFFRIRT